MKLIDYVSGMEQIPDERAARGLIMRGDVLVDGQPVTSPHKDIEPTAEVRIKGLTTSIVSRGELKLGPALKNCKFTVQGCVCADLGSSTGGFTSILLQNGASRVYAVDVGYGVLDLALRNDPRVIVLERTNARKLTENEIPEKLTRVVGDLSFISWRAVIPTIRPLLGIHPEMLLLVKPQFELAALGRGDELDGGVVADSTLEGEALAQLYPVWQEAGLVPAHVCASDVQGAKGNQEYFVHLVDNEDTTEVTADKYAKMIQTAIEEVNR